MSEELHVVFGAGQVGQQLARSLVGAGKRVRVVRKSSGGGPAGCEVVQGDAADASFCAEATRGAFTVYHCMNPPYSARAWGELLPLYMDNLIAGASRAGARLVVLDNVYMLGRPGGRPFDEKTPVNPCSRKGEIRARVAERMFAAHRRGDLRATAARASDFYGPEAANTHLGSPFWKPAIAGKRVRVLIDPDAIHTYHYIPDVAAGLMTLGLAPEDAYGEPWMLPCAPAGTLRELVARLSRALGRDIALSRVPGWMRIAAGFFVPILGEVNEMMYQWEEPFVIDDRRFRARFGQLPTEVEAAAAATVAWARERFATPARDRGHLAAR